jgi:hypothetical protein
MSQERPVVALTLEGPLTLGDVLAWSDLALGMSFSLSSPLSVQRHPNTLLTVRSFLSQAAVAGVRRRDPETGRFLPGSAA